MLQLLVDFNALTPDGKKVWINHKIKDDEVVKQLQSGLRVLLYDYDIKVEANLEFEVDEDGREWWYGLADWPTQQDMFDE